jgi:hypothetical protein
MTHSRHTIGSIALILCCVGLGVASGCAGSDSPSAGATVTATVSVTRSPSDLAEGAESEGEVPAEPANPVPVLRKVKGCVIEDGTEVGDHDIAGNRYASCSFMDNAGTPGTSVTVRTYPGDPMQWHPMPDQLKSDDSTKVIMGDDFTVVITGDWQSYSRDVDPNAIAKLVGGTFQAAS